MQTIFRTAPISNFAIFTNELVNTPMPFKAKEVLFYLLAKPKDWRVKVADIRNNLALTTHTIRKSLEWLQQAGYAGYIRLKTGHTIWKVFDKPQAENGYSPRVMPKTVTPHAAKPSELQIKKDHEEINKQLPEPQKTVVVSLDDKEKLIYPEKLSLEQKKACKAVIKKAPVALQQEVLFELAYRMTMANLKSVPGYLNTLVTSANKGTFTRTGATTASKPDNRHIDSTQALLAAYRQLTTNSPEKAKGFIQQAKSALRGVL